MPNNAKDIGSPPDNNSWLNFFKLPTAFISLRVPGFRWFWLSSVAAYAAMQMMWISQGFLIYESTGSTIDLGLVMVAFGIPLGVLAPIGGVITDRLDKVKVVTGAILINIFMALYVGVIVALDMISLSHILVSGALSGTALAFNMPGRMALVRDLVGPDMLLNAVSLNTGAMNLTRIVAPAIAGFIIVLFSQAGVFFVIAGLYFIALIVLLPIKPENKQTATGGSMVVEVKEGLVFVKSAPSLVVLLILGFIVSALGMNYMNLMPAFAKESLDLGAGGLGILLSSTGIGALVGSLATASLGNYQSKGKLLLGSVILWGITIFLFSISNSVQIALLLLLFVGFAQAIFMAVHMTLIQINTPEHMQGRVMSMFTMTFGLMPIGVIPISILAETEGTPYALAASAIIITIMGILLALFAGRLRNLA